jgi:hypothetical protein
LGKNGQNPTKPKIWEKTPNFSQIQKNGLKGKTKGIIHKSKIFPKPPIFLKITNGLKKTNHYIITEQNKEMNKISKVSDILSDYFYTDIINIIIKKFNCEFENVKDLKTGDYIYKYYKYTKKNNLFIVLGSCSNCYIKCVLVDHTENYYKLEWLDSIRVQKDKEYKKLKDEYKGKLKCLSNVYYE